MDILLSFFFLIIASIVGISLCLLLGMTSYLKIAILVMCIFIPMELYNEYFHKKNNKSQTNIIPMHNSQPNTLKITNTTSTSTTIPIPDITKYGSVDNKSFEMDKPPFDGLGPAELLSRLNYIYYATANPLKPINYLDYKTHADKLLNSDNTKLSTNDTHLLEYSKAFYPQLSENQIDTKDCLNGGSEKTSCFQNPSLFFNVKNDFNILTKGVNEDNANLLIREDFSNPMTLDTKSRYEPVLFMNAPNGNLDRPLDQQSNETINLDIYNDNGNGNATNFCRHCKLAMCKNDYCSLQNQLFM